MICLGIFWHAEHWETVKEKENLPGPIDISNITYKSDIQIKDEKRYFALSGFCYKLNERVQNFDISIALKEMGKDDYILIPTHMVIRNDLSRNENMMEKKGHFAMYDASGFETKIRKSKLEHNKKYKVYIFYKSNHENTLIDTGESIYYE